MKFKFIASICLVFACNQLSYSQTLTLQDALNRTVNQYNQIKAKQEVVSSTTKNVILQKQQYLPDLTLSAQQSYGTINSMHGTMYAHSGLASAATSMPLAEQNWNAAFGSLYFANINWNLFTFGRISNQIELAEKTSYKAKADLQQEIFQQQIKTSAVYLNLIASQRIKEIQNRNWERAKVFHEMTAVRAKNGLIPEVDERLAKAEVSNAKSLQLKAYDKELELSKQLAILMNDEFKTYQLDSLYSTSTPSNIFEKPTNYSHPFIELQQAKIDESQQLSKTFATNMRPSLTAFGVIQGRGSGFEANYGQDLTAYSTNYAKGVGIDRSNYLVGLSLSWNITNIFRTNTKVQEQKMLTKALQYQLDAQQNELDVMIQNAHAQIQNAYDNFNETKVQVEAAQIAYKQHNALYENGLTNLIDYTQALYSLNRAEIEYEIAQNNVWQALLLLASAQGNLEILVP